MRTPPPVSAFWRTLASAAAAVLALVAPARADIDLEAIKPDGVARAVDFRLVERRETTQRIAVEFAGNLFVNRRRVPLEVFVFDL